MSSPTSISDNFFGSTRSLSIDLTSEHELFLNKYRLESQIFQLKQEKEHLQKEIKTLREEAINLETQNQTYKNRLQQNELLIQLFQSGVLIQDQKLPYFASTQSNNQELLTYKYQVRKNL